MVLSVTETACFLILTRFDYTESVCETYFVADFPERSFEMRPVRAVFITCFSIHAVEHEVVMYAVRVGVRCNHNLEPRPRLFSEFETDLVRFFGSKSIVCREALYVMIEHYSITLLIQILCSQKFIFCKHWITIYTAYVVYDLASVLRFLTAHSVVNYDTDTCHSMPQGFFITFRMIINCFYYRHQLSPLRASANIAW